jgi:hypothetical protein
MSAIKTSRRSLLKSSAAALAAFGTAPLFARRARAQGIADRKYLFVVGANGGASIIDGFLPITQSAAGYSASQLSQPAGSNLRCPKPLNSSIQGVIALGDGYDMSTFLSKHSADTVVMTQEGTSVNHQVAARRAITGNNINQGRTLLEAMALRYGDGLILPACAMGGGGYADAGDDVTVPDSARAEPVMDARLFAFSTHGSKGVMNAPDKELVDRARTVRAALEERSGFAQTFGRTSAISRFKNSRDVVGPGMEASDLITKLMMLPPDATERPLIEQGLETSADGQLVLSTYPNLMKDPFDAQAALAFLLVKNGVSCAVTLSPSSSPVFAEGGARAYTAPLGFDWSHTDHRGAQNAMWGRVMHVVDGLVDLLKGAERPGGGGSLWDQSLIYIATEFGRDKIAVGGSGHHLNNGNVLVSPLLNGNRVYGGVDPQTALTHGFDPSTGDPTPNAVMREGDVYSAVCHALDIDFAGRHDMPCMIRA